MNRRDFLKLAGIGLGSVALGAAPGSRPAFADIRHQARTDKTNTKCRTVVFGVDGLSFDAAMHLLDMGAPALSALHPPMYAMSGGGASQTAPGWADIWCGLPSLLHNTYSNGMYGQMPDRAHILVRLIDKYDVDDFYAGWVLGKPLRGLEPGTPHHELYERFLDESCTGFYDDEDVYRSDSTVYELGEEVIDAAQAYDNFCLFIHFANPDTTGHETESWDDYLQAAWDVDTYVSNLMETLPEDTNVIYCSDHGFNFTERGKVENNHNYAPDGMFACSFDHTRYSHITRQTIARTIYRLGNEDPNFVVGGLGEYAMYGSDII